tara:strand:- start:1410 stop:1682 length:273 start_codon:yes stop_codon:yes gene_type:complete
MKFLLTIYVCSVVGNQCAEVPQDQHKYESYHNTHYSCVQKGLGESYEVLYGKKTFTEQQIESLQLFPRFTCQTVIVPKKKPDESKNTIES